MKNTSVASDEYTPEQRLVMLAQMRTAARSFYAAAQHIGYHEFLELTGLMNEIIKVCERAHMEGRDFATNRLDLFPYEAGYIGEKIGCIIGAALEKEDNWKYFVEGIKK